MHLPIMDPQKWKSKEKCMADKLKKSWGLNCYLYVWEVDVYIAKEKQQELKDPNTDLASDSQIKEIASISRSRSPKKTKKPEPTREKTTSEE